eukprot:m.64964 g.64964  ORF g.64964 m.64964 type:complete len:58 (-) comp12037_c0_seq3:27-200(-)
MYVVRSLDKTSPSRTIPTPTLLALPSNPMTTTMVTVTVSCVCSSVCDERVVGSEWDA